MGFEWDYRNRLAKAKYYTDTYYPSGDTVTVTFPDVGEKTLYLTGWKDYLYDVHDQLIAAEKYGAYGEGGTLTRAQQFVYRQGHCVVEFDDSGSGSVAYRLYGPGVDMPLAVEHVVPPADPNPAIRHVIWTLTDQQGTVRALACDEGATFETWHVKYTAFGVPTRTGGLPALVNTFYAGRDLDRFTGLYNNRARWYDAGAGRFISEDPLSFAAGDANLYRYCGNSPTNATDPTGQWIDRLAGAVVGAIHGALDVYAANPDASFWEYLTGAGLGALSGAVNPMGEFISAGGAILGGIIDVHNGGSFLGEGFQAGGLIGGLVGGGYAAGKAAFRQAGGKVAGWAAARAGFSAGAKTFGIEGTGAAIGFGYGMVSTGGDFQTSLMYANWGQMAPAATKALARGGAGLYRKFGGRSRRFSQTGAAFGDNIGSADEAYGVIRSSTSDVGAIGRNTGIKPQNIQKVKQHVFHQEHLLDRYVDYGVPAEWGRFDSSMDIANSWKRLEQGTHTADDLRWLRHETAEAWYMRKHGPGYSAAHDAATRYPSPF